jgi:hypothetical protein
MIAHTRIFAPAQVAEVKAAHAAGIAEVHTTRGGGRGGQFDVMVCTLAGDGRGRRAGCCCEGGCRHVHICVSQALGDLEFTVPVCLYAWAQRRTRAGWRRS